MSDEYIVVVKEGYCPEEVWNMLENLCEVDGVPTREVPSVNTRDGFDRLRHYILTADEAMALSQVESIEAVDMSLSSPRCPYKVVTCLEDTGNYSRSSTGGEDRLNWGLLDISSKTSSYTQYNYNDPVFIGTRKSTLSGKHVDIVIMDTGINTSHPEFTGRCLDAKWTEYLFSLTETPYLREDVDGHGTHVASLAAGNRYGLAYNANIYDLPVKDLESRYSVGIPMTDCFDVLLRWHNKKPINPETGRVNPTVVNMSFAMISVPLNALWYTRFTSKGVTTDISTLLLSTAGKQTLFWNYSYIYPLANSVPLLRRVASIDVAIQALNDAGIHVVIAAGNSYTPHFNSDSLHYDNVVSADPSLVSWLISEGRPTEFYIHRGGSPNGVDSIKVGNVDSSRNFQDAIYGQMANLSSVRGPGVDVYAPGTNIVGALSNLYDPSQITNPSYNYFGNSSYKSVFLTGTSMASPIVAGLCALYLESDPTLTPKELKKLLLEQSCHSQLESYTNANELENGAGVYLFGGTRKFVYNPFNTFNGIMINK